jgi:hypothetical protein
LEDPSSDFGLPFKVAIDGRDRTAVWFLSDKTEPAESFAKGLIDLEALTKEMHTVKKAEEVKVQFEYKGHQVEITGDQSAPFAIMVDGEDYTPLWNSSDSEWCAATWIKGHLEAQLRSKPEFKIRSVEEVNKTKGWKPEAVSDGGQTVRKKIDWDSAIQITIGVIVCGMIVLPFAWLLFPILSFLSLVAARLLDDLLRWAIVGAVVGVGYGLYWRSKF